MLTFKISFLFQLRFVILYCFYNNFMLYHSHVVLNFVVSPWLCHIILCAVSYVCFLGVNFFEWSACLLLLQIYRKKWRNKLGEFFPFLDDICSHSLSFTLYFRKNNSIHTKKEMIIIYGTTWSVVYFMAYQKVSRVVGSLFSEPVVGQTRASWVVSSLR